MAKAPLNGIRVLELGGRWAVPHCTEMLSDMGAQVIKVEEPSGDSSRGAARPSRWEAPFLASTVKELPHYNRAGSFLMINRNKWSIGLDFRKEEGKALFCELVKKSDIVVENMHPGRLDKHGLSYEALKQFKPDLIMCSAGGFGKTGPDKFRRAVGVTIEPYCLSSVTGYSGGGPMKSGVDHIDPLSGIHALGGILAALIRRRRTGQGAYIDLAFVESATCTIGPFVLAYGADGRLPGRKGNQHSYMAPHGCYRCQGEDDWIAIAVRDDRDWTAFCQAMQAPQLATDARFADAVSRWDHQEELNGCIEEMTARRERYELMETLQAAGVPAGAALSVKDLVSDAHMKERGFFQDVSYPSVPSVSYKAFRPRYRLSKTPLSIKRPAPGYGEHNKEVWIDIMGLDKTRYEQLVASKIILNEPLIERKDLF